MKHETVIAKSGVDVAEDGSPKGLHHVISEISAVLGVQRPEPERAPAARDAAVAQR